jgi:archaeal flagellin FlaB
MFRVFREQKGITGLETAIILIAFVIVASILAYIVISAGLFSSQKAKQAVNDGFAQTGATIELKGNVVASVDNGDKDPKNWVVTNAYLTLSGVPGGDPIDLTAPPAKGSTDAATNKLIVSYSDSYNQYPSLPWTATFVGSNNGDSILDPGEMAQINVDSSVVNDLTGSAAEKLLAYHTFTLEVKPNNGPVLTIERTVPGQLSKLTNLR